MTLGVYHALALSPCPSDQNATFDNCFGTYDWTSGDNKGDKFIGKWKKDNMHGQSTFTFTFAKGDKYVGVIRMTKGMVRAPIPLPMEAKM